MGLRTARWPGCFLCLLSVAAAIWADEPAATSKPPAPKAKDGQPLNPRGKPNTDSFTDLNARYFVWQDAEGWHLRTASKKGNVVKFEGTIELSEGQFGKLRRIGLEGKGKYADAWQVDAERQKIEFRIFTAGSFDGFDFTVARGMNATVTYDLKIGEKVRSDRVFVGENMKRPAELPLVLAVEP